MDFFLHQIVPWTEGAVLSCGLLIAETKLYRAVIRKFDKYFIPS